MQSKPYCFLKPKAGTLKIYNSFLYNIADIYYHLNGK